MVKKQKKGICSVPDCGKEIICLGVCECCYQRMRYWERRSTRDKIKRIKQIQVWEHSLDLQLGNVQQIAKTRKQKKTNVQITQRKRKTG